MHEMSLMENALVVIDHVLADYHEPKVKEVVLKVGRLANCIPGALEFAFEALTRKGGACKGARLVLEEDPVILKCEACGKEFAARDFPWTCSCGSQAIQIVSGTEVYVANIDIDE